MRSLTHFLCLGVAALGLTVFAFSPAQAQFRTLPNMPRGFNPNFPIPGTPLPSMTFVPPIPAMQARLYTRLNLGYTPNPYLPNPQFLAAHGYVSPHQAARLAYAYSPLAYAQAASYNPSLYGSNLYNPVSMMGYGSGYGGYGGGYSGGYGGGYGSGYAGSGGYGAQNPYLPTSGYQNPPLAAAPATSETTPTVTVNVYDGSFQPRSMTIAPGTTVVFKNVSSHLHTVTSDTGLWDSRELDPGKSVSVYFAKPGAYPYHCILHRDKMRATITVE